MLINELAEAGKKCIKDIDLDEVSDWVKDKTEGLTLDSITDWLGSQAEILTGTNLDGLINWFNARTKFIEERGLTNLGNWEAAGKGFYKDMDNEDVAALASCVASLGVLMSSNQAKRGRRLVAGFVLGGVGIPLAQKFLSYFPNNKD